MIKKIEETGNLKSKERGRCGLQSILSERDRIVRLLSRLSCQVRKCTATQSKGEGERE